MPLTTRLSLVGFRHVRVNEEVGTSVVELGEESMLRKAVDLQLHVHAQALTNMRSTATPSVTITGPR